MLLALNVAISKKLYVTLLASMGLVGSMNIGHMSMQTVLIVKLFVTLFENMGVGGSMNIDHV